MPTYEIWYDETYTNKAWFTADNEEQALEQIGQVQDGEAEFDSLKDFQSKDKGYELQIELSTMNTIEENA